jgi:acetyl esterase/lipase
MLRSSLVKIAAAALLAGAAASSCAEPMQGFFRHRGNRQQLMQRAAARNGPVTIPAGAREVQDVAYGSDPMQRMDVYIPQGAKGAPVILMVHGGGWVRGDKAAHGVIQNKINYFLPRGYVVISINYRLVPQVNVMTEADDVAHALAYAQQHAAEWGGDASRFVLMGHSAGAHLVTMLSAVPGIWQGAGAHPWLGTIPLDSAAYNVVEIMNSQHFSLYDRAFDNDQQLWSQASPTLRLQSAPPPMLLVCDSRRANSCDQANAFADKAKSFGGKVSVFPISMRHGEINLEVGVPGDLTSRIDEFLHSLGLG